MKVLELDKYDGLIVTGDKDSGKSVFLEWAGEQYYKRGRLILDLFDAGDFESAFWCVPAETSYPIILVHPPSKSLDVSQSSFDIIAMCDTVKLEEIFTKALAERRIIVLACAIYDMDDLLYVIAKWLREIPDLMIETFTKEEALVLIREAANVVFSRYKVFENQTLTQKALLDFLRRSRHWRTSYIFDSQRFFDLYEGHRFHFMKRIIKKTSHPKGLEWVDEIISQNYSIIKELGYRLPNIAYLRKSEFYCVWSRPSFKYFTNPLPRFHHKTPLDNFYELAKIKVKGTGITRDTEFLDKRQVKELKYLRKAASVVSHHIQQKELIFEGKPYTFTLWAKEVGVATSTLTKYTSE